MSGTYSQHKPCIQHSKAEPTFVSNVSSGNFATLKDANRGSSITAIKDTQPDNVKVWRNLFGMNLRANNPLSSSGPFSSSAATRIPSCHTPTRLMPKLVSTQATATRLWEGPTNNNGTLRKLANRVNVHELSRRCLISLLVADGTSH